MEKIWYKDIQGLMTEHNFVKFFPTKEMTFAEQLNAILRFSIYFSIVMFIIKKDTNVFMLVLVVALFTFLIYSVDEKNKIKDKQTIEKMGLMQDRYTKEVCQRPTEDNPFMNVLISDIKENPERPRACRYKGKVKADIKKAFDTNLYRDVDDVFQKKASDRQYYTTAITTIPNDVDTYAKWLYMTGKTCKEGNGDRCYTNTYKQ
jgi:Ca2+/Na+ antiporter